MTTKTRTTRRARKKIITTTIKTMKNAPSMSGHRDREKRDEDNRIASLRSFPLYFGCFGIREPFTLGEGGQLLKELSCVEDLGGSVDDVLGRLGSSPGDLFLNTHGGAIGEKASRKEAVRKPQTLA